MALKVLGQAAPLADTDTDLYTVPAATETVVSTITVCTRAGSGLFSVAVRPGGAVLANEHYIVYEAAIWQEEMVSLTLGLTLAAGDVLTVRGTIAELSFSAFGQEAS